MPCQAPARASVTQAVKDDPKHSQRTTHLCDVSRAQWAAIEQHCIERICAHALFHQNAWACSRIAPLPHEIGQWRPLALSPVAGSLQCQKALRMSMMHGVKHTRRPAVCCGGTPSALLAHTACARLDSIGAAHVDCLSHASLQRRHGRCSQHPASISGSAQATVEQLSWTQEQAPVGWDAVRWLCSSA